MAQNGLVEKTLNNEYHYPYRIGLWTGPVCQFKCTFCGRNYEASYKKTDIDPGSIQLIEIMKNAPKNDPHRFYLSGGLEPLTNPNIGKIVYEGSKLGFKLGLYTNGLALTEKILDKQPRHMEFR